MTRNEEIIEILKNMDKHIKYIEKKNINNISQLETNQDLYLAISMSVFTLLNNLIELGDEIIRKKNLELPQKYREIANILQNNSIITQTQLNIFLKLIKIRNNIAHEYDVTIKHEDILFAIQNIYFIKEIIKISINILK